MSKNKHQRGSVLIYILTIASIGVAILLGLIIFINSQHKASRHASNREQAFQIAESGIYWYRWYLAHEVEGKTVKQKREFWESGDALGVAAPYEDELKDPEGNPLGKYSIEVDAPDPDSTIVIVRSTGWTYRFPGKKRTIQVRFRQPAWCEYAFLADCDMRFGEGTEAFGKIHSNHGIRFDGLAHNIVSSAVPQYDDPSHGGGEEFGVHTHVPPIDPLPPNPVPSRPDVFEAGREFPVSNKDFNSLAADLNLMKEEAESDGLYLGQATTTVTKCGWVWKGWWIGFVWECNDVEESVKGYHIVLKNNHTMDISMVTHYGCGSYRIIDETSPITYNNPSNGIVFAENHVWVEGVIDEDRLTIAAADLSENPVYKSIYINNDIVYTNRDGRDILGLVAQGDISVGLYSEDDLEIDAALLAQNGRVGRNYYWASWPPGYAHRDTITVFGSIVTKGRYLFAWTDGMGYDTRNLYFDNNLIYWPPPFFPTGDQYKIDLWEEL